MLNKINNNPIGNLPPPSAPEEVFQPSKAQEVAVKTLYTIGVVFALVSLNFFLSPIFVMDAIALSVGISILSFKGAYDIHTTGELNLPKITLKTGIFQIGLT